MNETFKAGSFMVFAAFSFALNDTVMKVLNDAIALAQLVFVRGAAVSILLIFVLWAYRNGAKNMSRADWALVLVRAFAEAATAYFFLTALFHMPIANAIAILQLVPLSVALAAYLFLNTPLGWRRLSAIVVGFMGMLLIMRPGSEGFNMYTVYGLVAVGCLTVRELATRQISQSVPSLSVTFVSALVVCLCFGSVAAFEPWVPMNTDQTLLMAVCVISIFTGYFFSVAAMRSGDIATVSALRYSGLLFSIGFGFFVFQEWPDFLSFFGAGLIVASGLFALMRERQRAAQVAAELEG